MADRSFLEWPFFDDRHRRIAAEVEDWSSSNSIEHEPHDVAAACRAIVRSLGEAGLLQHAVGHDGGRPDVRSLCIVRETLARHSGLADFAFAMQGLGSGPVSLFGSDAQKTDYLPRVAAGTAIAAFAISEAEAGSDIGAMQATARRDGDDWVLDGEKTWISNAGIADRYVIFCRTPELGERGFGAFLVPADAQGLQAVADVHVSSPHVLGTVRLDGCRVDARGVIGEPGKGMRVALGTLDVFRPTVGAAALGFARRALDETIETVSARRAFGRTLAEHQMTQAAIAEMAVAVDASALLVYRAAWAHDTTGGRISREAAMAKLFATEAAQRVVDRAVQLHGARGVVRGEIVESLYREVRALRIYEGTSEIQKLVIAKEMLSEHAQASRV